MLRVEHLQFRRGPEIIFDDLDFVVHAGQTVAIAGRNGVGKSTLFGLIRGELSADSGEIDLPGAWRLAHLRQEVTPTDRPALEYVIDGHSALRAAQQHLNETEDPIRLAELHSEIDDLGGYRAEADAGEILYGLGFAAEDFTKPYDAFSGGWRIRLNLAQTLMTPCDLLLLDEPTNHLDLETIVWLEGWIKRFDGTVLIIAHDRSFLDACADHTLYLARTTGTLYSGNYSSCERQRAERAALEQAGETKVATQRAHLTQFIDRFRAKSSKAKQVQSRIKALERLQSTVSIHAESPYKVNFQSPERTSNPLFSLRNVALGYADTEVLSSVSQTILPGDRIGVLGVNGAGKSTLLKSLVGDLTPNGGEFQRGRYADVGYFAQHQLETLKPEQTALMFISDVQSAWREQQVRDFLGGWGFSNEMTTRPIATLSGGEKARLVLALIALEQPAVLVLDEPTNHLDLDMRDALAMALKDYSGAVIIVSHDRALLDKTVDEFWRIDGGRVERFDGDMDDYVALKNDGPNRAAPAKQSSRRDARRERAQARAELNETRKALKSVERELDQTSTELAELETQLADKATYDALPPEELDALLKTAGRLRQDKERLENRWLTLSETLEEAS